MSENNLVRVNTRISIKTNEFIDVYSAETGMSKSSIISLACEQFKLQHESIRTMNELFEKMDVNQEEQQEMKKNHDELMKKLESIEKKMKADA